MLLQGFVVCMGTDTMAFAASALSFMLENLGKAVVFTGSQIPFSEAYNDARRNLIVSCIFAASEDSPPEVSCLLLSLAAHTLT
jgi:L-asparaginase